MTFLGFFSMTFLKTPKFSKIMIFPPKSHFFQCENQWKKWLFGEFSQILGLSKMSSKNFQKKSHRKKTSYFFYFCTMSKYHPQQVSRCNSSYRRTWRFVCAGPPWFWRKFGFSAGAFMYAKPLIVSYNLMKSNGQLVSN